MRATANAARIVAMMITMTSSVRVKPALRRAECRAWRMSAFELPGEAACDIRFRTPIDHVACDLARLVNTPHEGERARVLGLRDERVGSQPQCVAGPHHQFLPVRGSI